MRTRVGYTGGVVASPTYRSMGDHTEAIEIVYDPDQISYGELLEIYWASTNPTSGSWSRQYRSAIWPNSPEQEAAAQASLEAIEAERGRKMYVDIEPAGVFTPAEDYHQKYYLRRDRSLVAAVEASWTGEGAWIDSTAAARLNGAMGGYGDPETIRALALPESLTDALLARL